MPQFNPTYQVSRIETAEQNLAREMARIDGVQRGRQPYTAAAETEEREKAWMVYSAEVNVVSEVFFDEIARTEALREVVDAELANPRLEWKAEQVLECEAHLTAISRDLQTYSLSELAAQMRAALASQTATRILAWRDALNARHRALAAADKPAPAEQRAAVATWAAEFDKRVRERPTIKRQLQDVDDRLNGYRDGLRRVNELTRARRVEAEQARLVATGNYGARISGPAAVRSIGAAPAHEMVEQH